MRYLRHGSLRKKPTPSTHRLRRGLPGYLILFAPHAFAPQRQLLPRDPPSPPVFLLISAHFTATPGIPVSPAVLKSARIARDRKSTRLNSSHVSISYSVF